MLSDEEKKAIEMIEHIQECNTLIGYRVEDRTILAKALLNLIEKQSKEIEELKEDSCCMTNCVRRDKEKLFLEDKIKAKIEYYKKINNAVGVRILELLLKKE